LKQKQNKRKEKKRKGSVKRRKEELQEITFKNGFRIRFDEILRGGH